jgi:hypothetical protein
MKTAKARTVTSWYRGTLRYDEASDALHMWPSALSGSTWSVYHTSVKLTDLFTLLGSAKFGIAHSLGVDRAASRNLVEMP